MQSEKPIAAAARWRPTLSQLVGESIRDLVEGVRAWRVWVHLGMNDIRMRYKRSAIGQNWQTLSVAIFVAVLTVLYSQLFGIAWRTYLPYVACSYSAWLLISGLVTDAGNAYVFSAGMFSHYRVPKSTAIYQLIVRNLALYCHNAVIIIPAFIIAGHPFRWTLLMVIPALVLFVVNAIWLGAVLGAVCARFRDVYQAIGSILQIFFFLTPVMYVPTYVPDSAVHLVDYNPFAHFLAIIRDPLLGQIPALVHYQVVAGVTVIGSVIGLYVFAITRRKLIYWL